MPKRSKDANAERRIRLQFDFSQAQLAAIDQMQAQSHAHTRAAVLRRAIDTYDGLVYQAMTIAPGGTLHVPNSVLRTMVGLPQVRSVHDDGAPAPGADRIRHSTTTTSSPEGR